MTAGENWGATPEERSREMPCDELFPDAPLRLHRAISIDAPPPIVFRWLCQLKHAPYSYDLLDNFGRRSPRELIEGSERLEVAQRFMFIFSLRSFERDRHITLRARHTAVTYTVAPHGQHTRLLARVIFDPPGPTPAAALSAQLLALGDLVMMRKQLLTLKQLAEREAATANA
jgi:hypothetical protein